MSKKRKRGDARPRWTPRRAALVGAAAAATLVALGSLGGSLLGPRPHADVNELVVIAADGGVVPLLAYPGGPPLGSVPSMGAVDAVFQGEVLAGDNKPYRQIVVGGQHRFVPASVRVLRRSAAREHAGRVFFGKLRSE